jgi:excisionase family DNA binding protein
VAEKEFLSFEEALKELRLKEEELKRLVSEGEIRAFREGETMKLRRSDVQNLRNELTGGEVVDLGVSSEELVFEDDADLDAGMATEEISEADTILEDEVEDVGEVELTEPEPVAVRAPSRRPAPVVVEEDAPEGVGMRVALIVTALILVLALPVCHAASTGHVYGLAKGIASVFPSVQLP